jgi:ABC-2 type transport system ATP-binding protein
VPTPSDVVTAEDIGHRYGDAVALRDCSFSVPTGAVVAFLGRNGAGKSTLLRAIAGLLRPSQGSLRVCGAPPGPGVLPRIGYVGQHAALYPMLTVAQTLRLGARLNPRWDAGYASGLADAAHLPATARVGRLSAGQRTRLALAMALGKRPDLLVLDEPLAGLDPVARTDVVGTLMAQVADRGVTVLMSSHVLAEVQDVCDHVVVLAGGRVRLAAEIEPALDRHRIAIGAVRHLDALGGHDVVELRRDGREFTALVSTTADGAGTVEWHRPTLDEMVLGYLRADTPQPTEEVHAA